LPTVLLDLNIQNMEMLYVLNTDMLLFMQATSCVKLDYMSSQEDINAKMRAILIDWLIEVEKHSGTVA
jgi:hypothetical protein